MSDTNGNGWTADALRRRFALLAGGAPGAPSPALALRGDHDLNPDMQPPVTLRPAAVLVPIVARAPGLTVLLTRRTESLAHHAGQVSFPGGHIEECDTEPTDCALRETEEEIGLERRHVEVIGRLDRYLTRTGFDVIPVVGLVTPPFDLDPDPTEVAAVFEVPLSFLLDPANHQRHSRRYQDAMRHFFAMPFGEHFIWGATAGMLMNLYEFLRRP